MTTRPRIRRAIPADAARIARIHRDSWRTAYAGILRQAELDRLTLRRLTKRWRDNLRGVAVAELNGVVEGFALIGPSRDLDVAGFAGEIYMLYVHPSAWGRGVGRALLRAAIAALENRGHRWLVLWVLAENTAAQAFYARVGLQRDGHTRLDRGSLGSPRVVRYATAIGRIEGLPS